MNNITLPMYAALTATTLAYSAGAQTLEGDLIACQNFDDLMDIAATIFDEKKDTDQFIEDLNKDSDKNGVPRCEKVTMAEIDHYRGEQLLRFSNSHYDEDGELVTYQLVFLTPVTYTHKEHTVEGYALTPTPYDSANEEL